jgi:FkbH-like protein
MWEFEAKIKEFTNSNIRLSKIPRGMRIIPSVWQEHCTECAIPECYLTCSLYEAKRDGSCRRFVGGIRKVYGLKTRSARIEFKRWGKLETTLGYATFSPFAYKVLNFANDVSCRIVESLDSLFKTKRFSQAFLWRRNSLVGNSRRWRYEVNGELKLIATIENGESPVNLFVEISSLNLRIQTKHLVIPRGISEHLIDITPQIRRDIESSKRFIRLIPAGDNNVELTFHRLEIASVKVKKGLRNREISRSVSHASFVKCVVWDLDNTLWQGVITEDDESRLVLLDRAKEILELLDSKGILNSIASKNNHNDAWEQLVKFGLDHYFVAPEINWNQKSVNIEKIASKLNIGVDSLLLIDDSDFELGEVARFLPTVRTLKSITLEDIPKLEYLNPPSSAESVVRRQMYQQEFIRSEKREQYGSNYLDFLRDCKLRLQISSLTSYASADRAFELLSRTNQLNLSGRKFTKAEFLSSISNAENIWLSGEASDKYGDYGQILIAKLVGYGGGFLVTDLAISCRVMEKFIEVSFFEFLRRKLYSNSGFLFANFIETAKNTPLKSALSSAGFQFTTDGEYAVLKCEIQIPHSDIVVVKSTPSWNLPERK